MHNTIIRSRVPQYGILYKRTNFQKTRHFKNLDHISYETTVTNPIPRQRVPLDFWNSIIFYKSCGVIHLRGMWFSRAVSYSIDNAFFLTWLKSMLITWTAREFNQFHTWYTGLLTSRSITLSFNNYCFYCSFCWIKPRHSSSYLVSHDPLSRRSWRSRWRNSFSLRWFCSSWRLPYFITK